MPKVKCLPETLHVAMRAGQKLRKGFSLIEVLFTMVVLSIGFVAVSAIMTGNIQSAENSKNQIIASQLAQEGIELVRNMKDNKSSATLESMVAGPPYLNYRIDETMPLTLDNPGNSRLYLNGSNFFTHIAGTSTKFARTISISVTGAVGNPSTRVITVTAIVDWDNSGAPPVIGNCTVANKCVSAVSIMPDIN